MGVAAFVNGAPRCVSISASSKRNALQQLGLRIGIERLAASRLAESPRTRGDRPPLRCSIESRPLAVNGGRYITAVGAWHCRLQGVERMADAAGDDDCGRRLPFLAAWKRWFPSGAGAASSGAGQVLIGVAYAGSTGPTCSQRLGRYPPPPGASDIPGLEVVRRTVVAAEGRCRSAARPAVCALVPSGGGYAEFCLGEGRALLAACRRVCRSPKPRRCPKRLFTVLA